MADQSQCGMPDVPTRSKLPGLGTTIFTVLSQRARELGALNLSQGFPDFAPPALLLDCLVRSASAPVQQYAPMAGLDVLREQAQHYLAALQVHAALDDITITLGATEALFSAIQALVQTGDDVIVFDPSYDAYVPAIELCGARAVRLPLQSPAFGIDWQRVRDAITARTRLIIINTPHNPTGAVWSEADRQTLAELLRDTDILVLSDEVYAPMVFDGRQHYSVAAHPELQACSLCVFSFGKVLHATGWRVGFIVAPPALTAEVRKVHQFNTFSIAHPLQWAIAEYLRQHAAHVSTVGQFYQARRDQFLSLLAGSRFRAVPSAGTYFQLLEYSAISQHDDIAFMEQLLTQHGVAAIPLSPFCAEPGDYRYLRFCFAKQDATLAAAAARLRSL